jgi:ABC-type uncharacterized transport system fused permease/ATPase subunit
MTAVLWLVLPIFIAVGSALIAVYIMQYRMEAQLARERQSLAEARASIEAQKDTLEELHRLRAEETRRKSLDEFLADLRTETRRFTREQKMLFATRKCLVVQERIYFRNIPLCNWVEHEVPVEEGMDIDNLAKTLSVFSPEMVGLPPARLDDAGGQRAVAGGAGPRLLRA